MPTQSKETQEITCFSSFKTRTRYLWELLISPVEYPVDEAKGKGWCDVCNATCSVLCFAPKACIVIMITPRICCCAKIEEFDDNN